MGQRYSQYEINQVIDSLNLVDYLVSEGIDVKRSGATYAAVCPFHDEKKPSLRIWPEGDKQHWHCFGCGDGGTAIDFYMKYHQAGFRETIEALAEKAGITLESQNSEEWKARQENIAFLNWAQNYFHQRVREDKPAEYLRQRGVSEQIQREWNLGYAGPGWRDLLHRLSQSGINAKEAEQNLVRAGLAKPGRDGSVYDIFRDRIMFPILDETGKTVGFIGRDLSGDDEAPKYLNSPSKTDYGPTLFKKDQVMYGLYQSLTTIKEAQFVYITEGNFDVITAHSYGLTNFVAPQGTAFTPLHAKLLAKYCSKVVFVFDHDPGGITSSLRSAKIAYAAGLDPEFVLLPKPAEVRKVDLDEYLRSCASPREEFQHLPRLDIIGYFLKARSDQLDLTSPSGKIKALDELVGYFKGEPDMSRKLVWVPYAAERLGVDPRAVEQRYFEKLDRKQLRSQVIPIPNNLNEICWTYLANLLIIDPHEVQVWASDVPVDNEVFSPEQQELYQVILSRKVKGDQGRLPLVSKVQSPLFGSGEERTVMNFLCEHYSDLKHIPPPLVRLVSSHRLPNDLTACKGIIHSFMRVKERYELMGELEIAEAQGDETLLSTLAARLDAITT
ncbi:MAG: DNA primase [Candidatus Woesearchaeota archaeon]